MCLNTIESRGEQQESRYACHDCKIAWEKLDSNCFCACVLFLRAEGLFSGPFLLFVKLVNIQNSELATL